MSQFYRKYFSRCIAELVSQLKTSRFTTNGYLHNLAERIIAQSW